MKICILMRQRARVRVLRTCMLAAATLFCGRAGAEDLVQVFALARAHEPAMQAAQAQARAAVPRAEQARAAMRPSVTATATSSLSRYDPTPSELDAAGTRVDSHATNVALNLRQSLFNPAASTDLELADVAQETAQAELEITWQEFILKVAQAYFDVLTAQDLVATKRQSRASFGEQLEWARNRFKAGLGIVTDQQDAQARYDLAESDVVTAENEWRARCLVLDRLTGRRGILPQPLTAQAGTWRGPPGDLDSWKRDAGQHPAVRRAQLAVVKARLDTRRAQASHAPTVALVGSIAANRAGSSVTPMSPPAPNRSATSSIGVELNVTLFDGFARQNRVAETLILEEQAARNLQAVVQSTMEATERAHFDLRSSLAQVRALEAAEGSTRVSLEGTQVGNRAGVRLNLDVLNAQALLFQTRSDLAKARHEVLMRSLRLSAAAGKLRPDNLVVINGLLAQ